MEYVNSYRKNMEGSIQGARPEQLMVMLYEGMIARIRQSQERFQVGQKIRAKEAATRAMKIADALMENLNMEEGGEAAKNLENLYFFIISELSKSCRTEDPLPHLDNSLRVIQTLYDGWKQLSERTA